jgi:hypothetical protein
MRRVNEPARLLFAGYATGHRGDGKLRPCLRGGELKILRTTVGRLALLLMMTGRSGRSAICSGAGRYALHGAKKQRNYHQNRQQGQQCNARRPHQLGS